MASRWQSFATIRILDVPNVGRYTVRRKRGTDRFEALLNSRPTWIEGGTIEQAMEAVENVLKERLNSSNHRRE